MKAEERYLQVLSEFQRKHLFELFYIPAILVAFLVVGLIAGKNVHENFHILTIPFAFGLVHILAGNILSFMYNLNWVIFPFAPKATPKMLKFISGLVLVITVVSALIKSGEKIFFA
jgi:hypothetical protein